RTWPRHCEDVAFDLSDRLLRDFAATQYRQRAAIRMLIRYSITTSAAARSDFRMVRPSTLAVLRLIASSYLVGACTGRSAGFSPLRMRSTYPAALSCRNDRACGLGLLGDAASEKTP